MSTLFFSWTGDVLSHVNSPTHRSSVSTEELMLPGHACRVFSRLRCNRHSLLSHFLISVESAESRIFLAALAVFASQFCFGLRTVRRSLFATLCVSTTLGPGCRELSGFCAPWSCTMFPFLRRGRIATNTLRKRTILIKSRPTNADETGLARRENGVILQKKRVH